MLDGNARTCVTFREMGKGHSSIEKFCMLMNIPPPNDLKGLSEHCHEIASYLHRSFN